MSKRAGILGRPHWSELQPPTNGDPCEGCYMVFCRRCKDRKGHHVCVRCERDCCMFCDGIDEKKHLCADCEDEDGQS